MSHSKVLKGPKLPVSLHKSLGLECFEGVADF